MPRRSRSRSRRRERERAPTAEYTDADGSALSLRGSLSPSTRRSYAAIASGQREDAWQRQVEFLFERLVVRWEIHDVPTEGQQELLLRLRVASQAERAFVRDSIRAHCAEFFPDLEAP